MKAMVAALIATLVVASGSLAAELPRPGSVDPRIQSVEYDPDQVVLLKGALGVQIMLEFGPGERLENVAIGDSLGWQVTPNKRADLLFIKPLEAHASTNMTVVTSQRRYVFELRVVPKAKAALTPYIVRFTYPAPAMAIPVEAAPEKPPEVVNADYVITGAREIRPSRVFDDGRQVYFQWPAGAPVPAIFAVAADNSESLVNDVVRGDYVVVEQMGPRFVLRDGKLTAMVVNRSYSATPITGSGR